MSASICALIPARAGSKRLPGKATRLLAGHPVIAYTIAAAQASQAFQEILVCSDDQACVQLANEWDDSGIRGYRRAPVPDDQPDIVWVRELREQRLTYDAFAILRPTSPFRSAATIRAAVTRFLKNDCDSLRAMSGSPLSPFKMWRLVQSTASKDVAPVMAPVIDGTRYDQVSCGPIPWHSRPTQTLPLVYVQNASLELVWTHIIDQTGTISGTAVRGFLMEGYEGFDLNTEDDWRYAQYLVSMELVQLPPIPLASVPATPPP